jgi:hypothetical protein
MDYTYNYNYSYYTTRTKKEKDKVRCNHLIVVAATYPPPRTNIRSVARPISSGTGSNNALQRFPRTIQKLYGSIVPVHVAERNENETKKRFTEDVRYVLK